ncbi:hypothetical protein [Burkholderia alba]|uniref:hypothetical protein n=1 Tax=Burkholderia alba TaxID=2683677 RepID=UPI002B052AA8|nr:hypothetical protein [Burkholderia alba]
MSVIDVPWLKERRGNSRAVRYAAQAETACLRFTLGRGGPIRKQIRGDYDADRVPRPPEYCGESAQAAPIAPIAPIRA